MSTIRQQLKTVKNIYLYFFFKIYFDNFGDDNDSQYNPYKSTKNYFNTSLDFLGKPYSKIENKLLNKFYDYDLLNDYLNLNKITFKPSYSNNNLYQISSSIPFSKTKVNSNRRFYNSLNKEIKFLTNSFKNNKNNFNRPVSNVFNRKNNNCIDFTSSNFDIKYYNHVKKKEPLFVQNYCKFYNQRKESVNSLFNRNNDFTDLNILFFRRK